MSLIARAKESLIAAAKEADPVTVEEFIGLIENLYHGQAPPNKFAIGVSGGVDSMALAFLCSEYAKRKQSTRFFPFTVDHSLRPESASEAMLVSRNLSEIGLRNPQVLNINWLSDQSKKTEETSREQRYLLLAQAMQQYRAPACLLAHTQDENVETFILRLLSGSGSIGLACMRGLAPIPVQNVFGSERMHIARPLLSIPKARLIATCLANNVTWYEDLTNHFATYAERNAIRFMYSKPENLPQALQKPNLIKTINILGKRRKESDEKAQQFLTEDFKNGRITLNPSIGTVQFKLSPRLLELNLVTFTRYLYLMIRRITPISDHSNIVSRLQHAAQKIRDYLAAGPDSLKDTIKTTSYELVWTNRPDEVGRMDSSGLRISKSSKYKMNSKLKRSPKQDEGPNLFTVYRQPYVYGRKPTSDIIVPSGKNNEPRTVKDVSDPIGGDDMMERNQTAKTSDFGGHSPPENISPKSEWTLWDGRYWIRLWIAWEKIPTAKSTDLQIPEGKLKIRLRPLDDRRDRKFLQTQYQHSSRELLKESKDILLLSRYYAFRQLQFFELIPAHVRSSMMILADPETDEFLSFATMGSEAHFPLPRALVKTIAPNLSEMSATLYWQTQLKHYNIYA